MIQLSAPARRALESAGLQTIEQAAGRTRYEIEQLHGIGKTAMTALDRALALEGLNYATEAENAAVSSYIEAADPQVRPRLDALRALIRGCIPQARETMSYGMPTYYLKENVIHFAAHKNHIGIYPTPQITAELIPEIKNYRHSKGALQLPHDQLLPEGLIKAIIARRLEQIQWVLGRPR